MVTNEVCMVRTEVWMSEVWRHGRSFGVTGATCDGGTMRCEI